MLESLLLHERMPAAEWAEANLIFPRGTSPNAPGPLSFERTPYLREILNCALDPTVENVYVSAGAQIGKTALLIALLGVMMGQQPGNGVWAMTSLDQVRDFSKKRVMEFIRANPCLARYIKHGDPTAFQPLNYQLMHMDVKFVGAGSPANLASTPAAWVIGDEVAKWGHINKDEAPPIQLLMNRTKAFPRRFHIFASTPTTVENEFWQGFIGTDMRQYFVPCPYCNGEFVFKFGRDTMRWDKPEHNGTDIDLAAATVRYICPHCAREIYEDSKPAMLAAGVWRPSEELRATYANERVAASKVSRGYHLDSMYSPFVSWGQYVRKFLECLQRLTVQTDLQDLRNSWMALPYEHTKVTIKPEHITKLCSDYERGEVPGDPYYISVGYDPGGNETHWVACALYEGGDMRVIDWGTLLQFNTEMREEEDGSTVIVAEGIAPHFMRLQWGGHKPRIGFIDAGYSTGDIYAECMLLPGQLMPTKGSTRAAGAWWKRPAGDSWPGLPVIQYSDYNAKISLYAQTIAREKAPRLMLPREKDCEVELLKGLSGQKLVEKEKTTEWKKVPDDHFGDCIKIQRVAWWAFGGVVEERKDLTAASLPQAGGSIKVE